MSAVRLLSGPRRRAALRTAVRVTLAVCAGFYVCRYGLERPVMAVYALFGTIALGVLSRVTGSGRAASAGVVKAMPAALALTAVGTLLAVRTWTAVLGMLVVGFALTFSAIAGPRVAGPSSGLQLCYILACFPPYAPQDMGDRLAGLALGMFLLAAAQRWILPEPAAPGYRARLALAAGTAAGIAAGLAATAGPRPRDAGPPGEGAGDRTARAVADALSPAEVPAGERPAAPSRSSRAYAQAGASARTLLHQLHGLALTPPERPDALAAQLLRAVADACRRTAEALHGAQPPPPDPGGVHAEIVRFQEARHRGSPSRQEGDPRFRAAVLATAESARNVESAVRVALLRRRAGPVEPRPLFWYADASGPRLWARRLLGHLTPRSVLFQNAVRVALGLGAARLVAGLLDLSHGFWVLLAVLTLVRTTVLQTRRTVTQALTGTLVGALCAAGLLVAAGPGATVYAGLLAPVLFATFALGPLLGIAWAQGLFTVLVSVVFAQLAPTTWQLDEVRLLDVLTGSAVGLVCGLLAWPRGARRELRNAMARLLHECASLVTAATAAILPGPPGRTRVNAEPVSHALVMAQTAYAQYLNEPVTPHPGRQGGADSGGETTDWHAALMAGQHTLAGSYWLPLYDRPHGDARTGPASRALADRAEALSRMMRDVAAAASGAAAATAATAASGTAGASGADGLLGAGPLPAGQPELADLQQWLDVLRGDVQLLAGDGTARARHGP
ncbi:FUSC family protein [Streptomyces sp. NPDC093595]|uniref:FUSC family protein n=1 Tax=Streptomyces sp. NPDC093595 TaxID=3366045 RepID=UPI003801DE41